MTWPATATLTTFSQHADDLAKQPKLLILDEPVASLDPLARRDFLLDLAEATAQQGLSVVHSSHLVSDVEREGRDFLNNIGGTSATLYLAGALAVLALPFLTGLFLGAPLITRELETGTYRLAWTQTSRTRWLAVKLTVTGLVAMTAAGLLSLLVTWWAGPIDSAIAQLDGRPGPGLLIFPGCHRNCSTNAGSCHLATRRSASCSAS